MDSTEDLWGVKKEEELPECSDGEEEERDLDRSDRTREPMLTTQEKERKTSKLRKTMLIRRVESYADDAKVGKIGGFEIRLSWSEETPRIRSRYRKRSASDRKAAAKATVYVR